MPRVLDTEDSKPKMAMTGDLFPDISDIALCEWQVIIITIMMTENDDANQHADDSSHLQGLLCGSQQNCSNCFTYANSFQCYNHPRRLLLLSLFYRGTMAQRSRNSFTGLSLVAQLGRGQTGLLAQVLALVLVPVVWYCAHSNPVQSVPETPEKKCIQETLLRW